ncbi:MAG TPA: DUF1573 domain-containing protein [Bacteroidales bacterium]|nr:DUF1573 domain-containing protein [Bacteroidales bacterium]
MKKVVLSGVLVLFMIFGVNAQTTVTSAVIDSANMPEISFDKLVHDYGTIELNGNGDSKFTFTNTGKEPLVLTNVRSSCGCTVPSWPKEPILPGKTGVIDVKYNTGRAGVINKSVVVTSNARTSTVTLQIKGEVKAPPQQMVPEKNVDQGSTPSSR